MFDKKVLCNPILFNVCKKGVYTKFPNLSPLYFHLVSFVMMKLIMS